MKCKTPFLAIILLLPFAVHFPCTAQTQSANNDRKLYNLPDSTLLSKGEFYFKQNQNDSALFYFSFVYTKHSASSDTIGLQMACQALNKCFKIYFFNCNYKKAFDILMEALDLCQRIHYEQYLGTLYNNIGNLLFTCNEYPDAEAYFKLALEHESEKPIRAAILNNLGVVQCEKKNYDTALVFFRKAYSLRKKDGNRLLCDEYNNIGYANYELENLSTAKRYYDSALQNAIEHQCTEKLSKILTNIGRLHTASDNFDSAFSYLRQSLQIAQANEQPDRIHESLYALSEAYEQMGNPDSALYFLKLHHTLKDSLLNSVSYGLSNQITFNRDMSRIEETVRNMAEEQRLAAIKLRNKNIIQTIIGTGLAIVLLFLVIIYKKNKSLNQAYRELVGKNEDLLLSNKLKKQSRIYYESIISAQDKTIQDLDKLITANQSEESGDALSVKPGAEPSLLGPGQDEERCGKANQKYKHSPLTTEQKTTLLHAVEKCMEDPSIFCDPEFSLEKLAGRIGSNSNYTSQIINETYKKNFRLFINEHRIQEACRIMKDPKNRRYSLESIATMVGFKSKS